MKCTCGYIASSESDMKSHAKKLHQANNNTWILWTI